MVSVARIVLFLLGGAVIGLLLAVTVVFLFVDNDMVLLYYILGMSAGALVGLLVAVRQPRRHPAPTPNDR